MLLVDHVRGGGDDARAAAVHVLRQQRHAGEGLAAGGARVLLHVRVGLEVGAEVGSVRERPPAVLAGERLLPGVSPHVSLQQPRPRKRLPAHGTLARQRVSPNVHFEST